MLPNFVASQLKKPRGLLGILASNLMIKKNEKNYNRLIEDLNLHPQDKILEIGYGPGIGIGKVAKICPHCAIHGIDFSSLMYRRASNYNKRYIADGRVQLHCGDFLGTTTLDNDYNKAFCLNVIYFWDELKSPFKKLFSLLKKNGVFHIYMADRSTLIKMKTPDNVFNKYSLEQVVEALKSAGFESVEHYSENGLYIKAKK